MRPGRPLVNHCEEGAWGVYALGRLHARSGRAPRMARRPGRSYRLARRHQPHGGQQPGRRLPRGRHANIARDGPLRRDADAPTTRRMAKVAPETRSARTPSATKRPESGKARSRSFRTSPSGESPKNARVSRRARARFARLNRHAFQGIPREGRTSCRSRRQRSPKRLRW